MRERGILFSNPMVRALLAGTKTQTRRALCAQSAGPLDDAVLATLRRRFGAPGDRLWVRESYVAFGHWQRRHNAGKGREEWFFTDLTLASGFAYRFDGADPHAARGLDAAPTWHPRPALFMPRAACRILLEVTDVRAERLHEIGPADAIAEGILRAGDGFAPADAPAGPDAPACTTPDPVLAYRAVWERINGAGSWDANPWVAVVTFRRLAR
ncbi:hypothetical protein [Massilia sp. 9096]|uniref:hypothetical protein n=1 Tax=Massilia sp. 9096 TaxID=1500894 RepID=UPI00056C11BD|nr:hypothetical protein [Massilia sp. 9096]